MLGFLRSGSLLDYLDNTAPAIRLLYNIEKFLLTEKMKASRSVLKEIISDNSAISEAISEEIQD